MFKNNWRHNKTHTKSRKNKKKQKSAVVLNHSQDAHNQHSSITVIRLLNNKIF
jgi:hypothetical protein